MANTLYDGAVDGTFDKLIDWVNDTIYAIGVNSGYTPNFTTHLNLSDIPGGDRVTSGVELTGKSFTGRVFKASALIWTSVTGSAIVAVVYYKHTGVESTSKLLYWNDTAANLPITPIGTDIAYTPDPLGIFNL